MFTIFATSFSTGNLLLKDCFDFRISPRGSDICPNPEEPEGEDKDVQMERMRTTNAVTVADFEEVEPLNMFIQERGLLPHLSLLKNTLRFFHPQPRSSVLDISDEAMPTTLREQGRYTHVLADTDLLI